MFSSITQTKLRCFSVCTMFALFAVAACAQTTVALQLAANPITQGNVAIVTATVTLSGAPAKVGIVDLYDGTKVIGSSQVTGIASAYGVIGNAVFRKVFAPGAHNLKATYRGTRTIASSTSPVASLVVLGTPATDLGLQYAGTTSFYNNGAWDLTYSFALSDLNNDGLPDIAALQFVASDTALGWGSTLNPGQFTTSNSFIHAAVDEADQILAADLNGDGLLDLVIVSNNAGTAYIYIATAPGVFSAPREISLATTMYPKVAIADFNGDGLPDIVSVGYGNGNGTSTLAAFFNNPASPGTFLSQSSVSIPIPETVGWLQTADLNGDGLPDLIANASSFNETQGTVLLNNPTSPGLSWTATTYDLGVATWHTTLADLNGDGLPDLIAGAFNGTVLVALNDSSHPGNLLPPNEFLAPSLMQGSFIADVAAGYVDGDNLLDVVATDYNNHFVLFHGNGDGTLTPGAPITVGPTPLTYPNQMFAWSNSAIAIADVDGDGLGDVVVTELHQNLAQVYRHTPSPSALVQTATDLADPYRGVKQGLHIVLTATETAVTGVMTGTVTFQDGFGSATNTTIGTAPIVAGVATFTVANPSVGFHDYYALFYGDSTFAASQSADYSLVVLAAPVANVSLSGSPNPAALGQTVLFSATVTASSGNITPTGTVQFMDGSQPIGLQPLSVGAAALSTASLAGGRHNITAVYSGDSNFASSQSTTFVEIINATANATATVTVNPASAVYDGAPIKLTATVDATGSSTPTGTETFFIDGVSGTPQTLTNGVATLTLPGLPGGTHTFTCTYSGDATYNATPCNNASATITPAPTNFGGGIAPDPAIALQVIGFQLILNITSYMGGNGQPIPGPNNVTLSYGIAGATPVTVPLVTNSTGTATYNLPNGLTPGVHTVTYAFAGTANLQPCSQSATLTVTGEPTGITLTAAPSPGILGQNVTLTANIGAANTPTGSIIFLDAGTPIGSGMISASGVATFTTNQLALGTHPLTATYAGGGNFLASTSLTFNEQIIQSSFTLTLVPSTLTLVAGTKGTVALQLSSIGAFAGPLTLSYGPLPAYATASLSPSTVTLTAGGQAASTFTLTTTALAANTIPTRPGSRALSMIMSALLLALLPFGFSGKRRRNFRRAVLLLGAIAALQALTGCTNIWSKINTVAAGTYSIPITATDANHNTQTQVLTVVITQ